MNCLDYIKDDVDYEFINIAIIDGNVVNMSLITSKGKYDAIDADHTSCHGYYIIIFSSPPYTLQEGLNIYGQVISSG